MPRAPPPPPGGAEAGDVRRAVGEALDDLAQVVGVLRGDALELQQLLLSPPRALARVRLAVAAGAERHGPAARRGRRPPDAHARVRVGRRRDRHGQICRRGRQVGVGGPPHGRGRPREGVEAARRAAGHEGELVELRADCRRRGVALAQLREHVAELHGDAADPPEHVGERGVLGWRRRAIYGARRRPPHVSTERSAWPALHRTRARQSPDVPGGGAARCRRRRRRLGSRRAVRRLGPWPLPLLTWARALHAARRPVPRLPPALGPNPSGNRARPDRPCPTRPAQRPHARGGVFFPLSTRRRRRRRRPPHA